MDLDEDILQDFLIEAGEIIELLQEQIVDLENNPEDSELLNAIFRGYHTIKGGAGFLGITPMVEVCHAAENLFDLLRSGKVSVSSELMDVILQATDVVTQMFGQLQTREEIQEADREIVANLHRLAGGEASSADEVKPQVSEPGVDEMSQDEFDALLDGLDDTKDEQAESNPNSNSEDVTDQEFEEMLDQMDSKKQSSDSDVAPQSSQAPESEQSSSKSKAAPKEKEAVEATVRVDTARLDSIMNMVGELVLVRNRLALLGAEYSDQSLSQALANLDLVTSDLQGAVMKTRMQPIKKVFGRFPRVVRDLSKSLKKEISLELEGEDTDLDKNLVEALADPLVHLVRNSVDHGVEMPDDRAAKGKPRMGTIVLAASQEGDHILLSIVDDGAGMDAEKIKNIAIERGVLDRDAADRMSETEAFNLIFMPGFSTKTEISDISGRGVGMDVVKTKISQLNGTLHIESTLGKGTKLQIKVPLTLAIMPTLMIIVANRPFALPLSGISEIFNLDLSQINVVNSQMTVIVRQKAIPIFYLDEWLVTDLEMARAIFKFRRIERKKKGHVVVVQMGTKSVGLVVDSLIGQQEVVIKPLGALLSHVPGMSGATITSDGGIALILDVPILLKYYTKTGAKNSLRELLPQRAHYTEEADHVSSGESHHNHGCCIPKATCCVPKEPVCCVDSTEASETENAHSHAANDEKTASKAPENIKATTDSPEKLEADLQNKPPAQNQESEESDEK
jgi:two-component system chemotaxis sensor kinase CheA